MTNIKPLTMSHDPTNHVVLAFDLAPVTTGWAVIDDRDLVAHGVVYTCSLKHNASRNAHAARHAQFTAAIHALDVPWEALTAILIETPTKWLRASRSTSTQTVYDMVGYLYLLELVCYDESNARIVHINPNAWQVPMLHNCPVGSTKQQSIYRAKVETELTLTEHEADAVNIAVWWLSTFGRMEQA